MKLDEGCQLVYALDHHAHYAAKDCLPTLSIASIRELEITGRYQEVWEFSIVEPEKWCHDEIVLTITKDAWIAFVQVPELFAWLGDCPENYIQGFVSQLAWLGAKDITEYVRAEDREPPMPDLRLYAGGWVAVRQGRVIVDGASPTAVLRALQGRGVKADLLFEVSKEGYRVH